jgi:hypothetical protein
LTPPVIAPSILSSPSSLLSNSDISDHRQETAFAACSKEPVQCLQFHRLPFGVTWDCRYSWLYEECLLLGYKTPVRTSQETHYVSIRESSHLMLCKIWDLHGGEYEKYRILRYKNAVRTSQETH